MFADLEHNLLNVGQPLEKGYHLVFANNCCQIFYTNNPAQMVADVKMDKNKKFPFGAIL